MSRYLLIAMLWALLLGGIYWGLDRQEQDARSAKVQLIQQGGFTEQEVHIPRHPDGHYYVQGQVNGREVAFVIDTGASFVTLGSAHQASLESGSARGNPLAATFHTANGVAQGQVYPGQEVRIGPFAVKDLRVASQPTLTGEALLGQNFLRHFEFIQRGDEAILRPLPLSRTEGR